MPRNRRYLIEAPGSIAKRKRKKTKCKSDKEQRVVLVVGKPKTNITITVGRFAPSTNRRAATSFKIVPSTATQYTATGTLGGLTAWVRLPNILTPLPHVTTHVIQAQFIRRFFANGMG